MVPPVAAVYVKVSVSVAPVETLGWSTVIVPEPFGA